MAEILPWYYYGRQHGITEVDYCWPMAITVKRNLIIGEDGLTVGKRVKKLREERGFSVAGLADAAKIDAQTLKKLEADGSNAPSFANGLAIAAALQLNPWTILGYKAPRELLDEPSEAIRRTRQMNWPGVSALTLPAPASGDDAPQQTLPPTTQRAGYGEIIPPSAIDWEKGLPPPVQLALDEMENRMIGRLKEIVRLQYGAAGTAPVAQAPRTKTRKQASGQ